MHKNTFIVLNFQIKWGKNQYQVTGFYFSYHENKVYVHQSVTHEQCQNQIIRRLGRQIFCQEDSGQPCLLHAHLAKSGAELSTLGLFVSLYGQMILSFSFGLDQLSLCKYLVRKKFPIQRCCLIFNSICLAQVKDLRNSKNRKHSHFPIKNSRSMLGRTLFSFWPSVQQYYYCVVFVFNPATIALILTLSLCSWE